MLHRDSLLHAKPVDRQFRNSEENLNSFETLSASPLQQMQNKAEPSATGDHKIHTPPRLSSHTMSSRGATRHVKQPPK
jgi:hypothetical protein